MLALALALMFQASPLHVDRIEIQGQVQKPKAFVVVSPPKALGLATPVSAAALAAAEHGQGAADRLLVARARIQAERGAADTRYAAWVDANSSEDPPSPDYRAALALLDAIRKPAPDDALVRAGLVAFVTSEPGPAMSDKRASLALHELAKHTTSGELAQWARLQLAERAFEAVALDDAKRWYDEAIAADPGATVADYLRYKLAWVLADREETARAITLFEGLASGGSDLAADADATLVQLFVSQDGRVHEAITFFTTKVQEPNLHLLRLAEAYADAAKSDDARTTLAALVKPSVDESQRAEAVRARLH